MFILIYLLFSCYLLYVTVPAINQILTTDTLPVLNTSLVLGNTDSTTTRAVINHVDLFLKRSVVGQFRPGNNCDPGNLHPEKALALDAEQCRHTVQLCRDYGEHQKDGVEREDERTCYALPEAFFDPCFIAANDCVAAAYGRCVAAAYDCCVAGSVRRSWGVA